MADFASRFLNVLKTVGGFPRKDSRFKRLDSEGGLLTSVRNYIQHVDQETHRVTGAGEPIPKRGSVGCWLAHRQLTRDQALANGLHDASLPYQRRSPCSHGAGRTMSHGEGPPPHHAGGPPRGDRGRRMPQGKDVIDETTATYKNIDAVMQAQADLVDIVYTLKQVVSVKS